MIRGGGKRAKASDESIPMVMLKPAVDPNDIPNVKAILEMQALDYNDMISKKNIEQLQGMTKIVEDSVGSNTDQNRKTYIKHFDQYMELQVF